MTSDNKNAVSTSRDDIPVIWSTGLLSGWSGVSTDPKGYIELQFPELAASSAKAKSDHPVVLILQKEKIIGKNLTIPAGLIQEVVFSNENHAMEFKARTYDNFDPKKLTVTFDESLFNSEASDFTNNADPLPNHDRANRLIGAASIVHMTSISEDLESEIKLRDQLVNEFLNIKNYEEVNDQILELMTPLLAKKENDVIFLAFLIDQIMELDRSKAFAKKKFIELLKNKFSQNEQIFESLEHIENILSAKKTLNPLRADHGLRSLKALQLFLLRMEPHEVITWAKDEEAKMDPLSIVIASCFAGLRSGWRALSVPLRELPEERLIFESALADACNSTSNSKWKEKDAYLKGRTHDPTVYEFVTEDTFSSTDQTQNIEKISETAPQSLKLFSEDQEIVKTDKEELVALLNQIDWTKNKTNIFLSEACADLKWEDLAKTRLDLKGNKYRENPTGYILIEGVAVIARHVDKKFIDRVSKEPEKLSSALKKLLENLRELPEDHFINEKPSDG